MEIIEINQTVDSQFSLDLQGQQLRAYVIKNNYALSVNNLNIQLLNPRANYCKVVINVLKLDSVIDRNVTIATNYTFSLTGEIGALHRYEAIYALNVTTGLMQWKVEEVDLSDSSIIQNWANSNLILTENRIHNLNGKTVTYRDVNGSTLTVDLTSGGYGVVSNFFNTQGGAGYSQSAGGFVNSGAGTGYSFLFSIQGNHSEYYVADSEGKLAAIKMDPDHIKTSGYVAFDAKLEIDDTILSKDNYFYFYVSEGKLRGRFREEGGDIVDMGIGTASVDGNGTTINGASVDWGGELTDNVVLQGNNKEISEGTSSSILSKHSIYSIEGYKEYPTGPQYFKVIDNPGGRNTHFYNGSNVENTMVQGSAGLDFNHNSPTGQSRILSAATYASLEGVQGDDNAVLIVGQTGIGQVANNSGAYLGITKILARVQSPTGIGGDILMNASGNIFTDQNTTKKGIEYDDDYSANYSSRSLIDLGYLQGNPELGTITEGTWNGDAIGDAYISSAATWNAKQDALGFTPENVAHKNAANGYAGLDSNSKINPSQLPAIAITDTFVVASQAAMLALTAETGDIAIRSDLSKTYILKGSSASTLADWELLQTPSDVVTSVFGRTGVVTAQSGDYTFAQLSSTPTTLAGYGITDAANLGDSDLTSSAASRTFNLHGNTSSDKLTISDGTNPIAIFRGDGKIALATDTFSGSDISIGKSGTGKKVSHYLPSGNDGLNIYNAAGNLMTQLSGNASRWNFLTPNGSSGIEVNSGNNINPFIRIVNDGAQLIYKPTSGAYEAMVLAQNGASPYLFMRDAANAGTVNIPGGYNSSFLYGLVAGVYGTASAMLHTKGSGTSNSTTSLLAQNSAGTNALKVNDDLRVLLNLASTVITDSDLFNNSVNLYTDGTSLKARYKNNSGTASDLVVGGGGSVTSVSVTTANGVSGSVATATSTPAITLTLGNITPTSVTSADIIGGTGTTSALTLKSTSGVGTTGADIIFKTGNNGATEGMRILNSGNVGIGTSSPATKLDVNGTTTLNGAVKITDGTQGSSKVLTCDASGNASWQALSLGSGTLKQTYQFSQIGSASSTYGIFGKDNNVYTLPTTDPYTAGISSGDNDPYIVHEASTVKSIRITFSGAATGLGSVGSSPVIRIQLYKLGFSTRTLLDTYDITISNSGVGTWNDSSGNAFQTAALTGLSTSLSAGDLIGIQFTNLSSNNNQINSLSNAFVSLLTTIN